MVRLISGDQKKVQMIPLDLVSGGAHSGQSSSPPHNGSTMSPSSTPVQTVICHDSNSIFDEELLDEEDSQHSAKRLKIALDQHHNTDTEYSGVGSPSMMDSASVASSACSVETDNTMGSGSNGVISGGNVSGGSTGGKKRKQSCPKKVIGYQQSATNELEVNDNATDGATVEATILDQESCP